MKTTALGVAVLMMMAGTAWGAYGGALTADRTDVMPGESFTVVLSLVADTPLTGWNAKFTGPAGYEVAPSYIGAELGWDVLTTGAALGWNNSAPVKLPLTSNFGNLLGSGPLGDTAEAGGVFQMVITVPAAEAFPKTVNVTVESLTGTDDGYNDLSAVVEPLAINITPEPVSALLLLAGLPMLRRRR